MYLYFCMEFSFFFFFGVIKDLQSNGMDVYPLWGGGVSVFEHEPVGAVKF